MISELCTCAIADGSVEVLLTSERHIEAPNWTPDGSALVVNAEGQIWRVPLKRPELLPVDTGFATQCNNDHGVSPDGEWLAISDKSEEGASCIYVLPLAGGMPRRVTENVPSYWHGWSPDGVELAFVGRRGEGAFSLFAVPFEGGDEVLLCDAFDHIDGPDYSPDGRYIWFNGERNGAVDLWRFERDGGGLTRMTDDDAVNWFPHPSPDGRHVVYLAYPPGTWGHPANLDVELRIMPADGGTPRTLVALFGGQGTINVPSWAPDSTRFAFVRYRI